MEGLRQKLENQGLRDVVYMVVNHQGAQSQHLHHLLAGKLSANITLYKQEEQQPDVWQTLGGEKDDFFIYDRCGRLTHHISLPYTIIGQGHVEGAIVDTYCKRVCGDCTYESTETPEECKGKADAQPGGAATLPVDGDTEHVQGHGHGHGHGHHHGHGHGHGHHHHGDTHGSHPHDVGHGHGHGRPHGGHRNDQGQGQSQQGQEQVLANLDHVDQMQQAQMSLPQEAQGVPARH